MSGGFAIRRATPADVPAITAMHRESFEALAAGYYSRAEIVGLMRTFSTVDHAMVAAGGLRVAEAGGRILASGGWTMGGQAHGAAPAPGQATIRSMFTHPDAARRGLARRLLELAESEAVLVGGADRLVLIATLSGAPFYRAMGYEEREPVSLPLVNGATFAGRRMVKRLTPDLARAA